MKFLESFFDLSEQCPNAVTFTIILPSIISRNSLIVFCFPENVIKWQSYQKNQVT